jgi:hypothetical protein
MLCCHMTDLYQRGRLSGRHHRILVDVIDKALEEHVTRAKESLYAKQ